MTNTISTQFLRKLEQKIQIMGEQLKPSRLHWNLNIAQVTEHATY